MRRLVLVAALLLLPVQAGAILYPHQLHDGCEGFTGAIGGATGANTATPWRFADGDVAGSNTRARTGWRSCAFSNPGSGDNIAVAEWASCSSPNDALSVQCAATNRSLGAQQWAYSLFLSGSPTTTGWINYLGARDCQDDGVSCSSRTWDDGTTFVKFNLSSSRVLSVSAQSLGAAVPTPTPGGTSSTCTAAGGTALATSEWHDLSIQFLDSTPSAGQYTVKVQVEDYTGTTFAPTEVINCALAGSSPSANIWYGWDKTYGTGPYPLYFDDLQWNQSTAAASEYLGPVKCYWLGTSATGGTAFMLTDEDATLNDWGGCAGEASSPACGTEADRLDAITQVPYSNSKYLCSCASCASSCTVADEQIQVFTIRPDGSATSAAEGVGGAPASISAYPSGASGPLVAAQIVGYVAGSNSGAVPKTKVGFRDGPGNYCRTGGLTLSGTSAADARAFSYIQRRDDGQTNRNACDQTINFDCAGSGANPCRGGAVDYAHQLEALLSRDSGTGEQSLLKQMYASMCYLKATQVPTPTATNTVTSTITRTPTITPTPLISNTPTVTRTPTWTFTSTRTPTSALTNTPTATFAATVKIPSHPHTSICQTGPCTFCLRSQTDPRVVMAQAKAASGAGACSDGVTVVIDRDFNAASAPTFPTDPYQAISGLGLFSNLTVECRDPHEVKASATSPLFHVADCGAACGRITLRGPCTLDGGSVAAGVPVVDLYGASHVLVDGWRIKHGDADGIAAGGGSAVNVQLRNNRFQRTTGGTGRRIKLYSCARGPCSARDNREAVVTATPTNTPT